MTNIGKVLSANPELAKNIDQIIFMGGGAGFGNHTPVAEFNICLLYTSPSPRDIR